MSRNRKCPCCGHPLRDDAIPGVELRGLQKRLFTAISKASPARISTDDLIELLYGDRSDGGPLCARNVVSRTVIEINKKISPHGLLVRGAVGRSSEGYALHAKV